MKRIVEINMFMGKVRTLDLGIEGNTRKRVVIFMYPGTERRLVARGYNGKSFTGKVY